MNITIITVGKKSEPALLEMMGAYEKRLQNDMQLEWRYIAHSPATDAITCRRDESKTILSVINDDDAVIMLDERGKQYDNSALSDTISTLGWQYRRLVIVIGGAFGVSEELRARANVVWSLSKLVFPHRLVRLMVVEQLYRSSMIAKGHPYHHK